MSVRGIVLDIQRFSLHDGPGIRTTVFLKGCPLRCPWCHNPESWEKRPQLLFYPEKCIGCGKCFNTCPVEGALSHETTHRINFDRCVHCGLCARTCYAQALQMCGQAMNAEQVLAEVERDRPFYDASGGGLTLSGGEPLAQPRFALALLLAARTSGLHTALDTSGCADPAAMEKAAGLADLVLFDLKLMDRGRHREVTGVDSGQILANFRLLAERRVPLVVRIPIIPGYTDFEENIRAAAMLAASAPSLRSVDLMRYHRLGQAKWSRLGKEYPLDGISPPTDETMNRLKSLVESLGIPAAIQG
ncbi:MAG: glycyl-radical enzyme activating protein [Planctomycetes bacterium]|nr:glycyl-radical enzyme activating protein [Planctomycetota bacterium]